MGYAAPDGAEDHADFDRILPPGWWLLPALIAGALLWCVVLWWLFQ